MQNTLPIPYRYPTHTLSTQETYHTDTLPITETETVTVTETEQNIKNIKNKRFKNSKDSDFEKDELEDETKNSSKSNPDCSNDIRDNPPTVPPDPSTAVSGSLTESSTVVSDDFTRDSARIQTAYKRLFKYEGDTSCLVSLLYGNVPEDVVDVMKWASRAHYWIVKSVPPERFVENFQYIKDIKRDVEMNDRRFNSGKSPPDTVDKEFLEQIANVMAKKRLE